MALQLQSLSEKQYAKTRQDLLFISRLQDICVQKNLRLIVAGGYAVDGALAQITRQHNDIDLQIYGLAADPHLVMQQLLREIQQHADYSDLQLIDKGREMYSHAFILKSEIVYLDVYYLQTSNDPFEPMKTIVKADGSMSESHSFETHLVTLLDVTFEATTADEELADKRYKREIRGDIVRTEHDQDMHNLQQIADDTKVEELLQKKK